LNFAANCEKERRAIEALGAALAGSNRPLVITAGTGMGNAVPGQPATEAAGEGVREYALDPHNAEALWKKSEELVGESFGVLQIYKGV